MSITNDPQNDFDWAYKGFQYPIPPSWKRAVRLEDQIQWLLQCCLWLNANGISTGYLEEQLNELREQLKGYTDSQIINLRNEITQRLQDLQNQINGLIVGVSKTRSVLTGNFTYIYVVLKQMWDMLRVKSMTYDEIKALGKTYDEIKTDGHTYYALEMFANVYYGDGTERVKFTPEEVIPVNNYGLGKGTGIDVQRTYKAIKDFGFLTYI